MEPLRARPAYRTTSACVFALVAATSLLGLSASGRADEPLPAPVSASIECAPVPEPGRVKCAVEARSAGAGVLRWGDVEIIATPDFVAPLRGRIGPRDAIHKEPEAMSWALALVAKKAGAGDVQANVRLVVCSSTSAAAPSDGEERCTPYVVKVVGRVAVGR